MKVKTKTEVNKKTNIYYLDVPFDCKNDIQLMYNIKWDMEKKSWFTNNESEVQKIEKKVEIFRKFNRECFEKSHDIVVKYVDFILDIFPPPIYERQEIVNEFYKDPIKCLDAMRTKINSTKIKEENSIVIH